MATYSLLLKVSFLPNLKKSQLVPSQQVTILGTCVDSHKMIVYLPKEKERKLLTLIDNTLCRKTLTIRNLAKVIGKLLSCVVTCPYGQLHYRNLERAKLQALRLNEGRWSVKCRLPYKARKELECWLSNLPNCFAPIVHPSPHRTIYMDACIEGWGCYFEGNFANGHFSKSEMPFSINTKETLAILYGIRSFMHALKGESSVLIMSDSTTAISYVRKMGGMQSELRSKIVKDLWNLGMRNNIWFKITHIPGVDNTESDWASRTLSEKTEYMLNHNVFLQTCKYFNVKPEIDLFSSRLNAQVKDYYSFGPDPYCKWVDAFTIPWDKHCCYYMFPPI